MNEKTPLAMIVNLYECIDKNGDYYLRGRMGNSVVLILKNNLKQREKDPDFTMNIAPRKEKKSDGSYGYKGE